MGEWSLLELHISTVIQLTPCTWLDIEQFAPLPVFDGVTSRHLPCLPRRLALPHGTGLLRLEQVQLVLHGSLHLLPLLWGNYPG